MFSKESVPSVNRYRKMSIRWNVMIVRTILIFVCQVENPFLLQNKTKD